VTRLSSNRCNGSYFDTFFFGITIQQKKKKEVDANRWETFVRIINEIDTKSIHFNYKSAKEIS